MSTFQLIDFSCHPSFWIAENNKAYILHRVKDNTTYLKCKLLSSQKCLGKAKLVGDRIEHSKSHTCNVTSNHWEIEVATAYMKELSGLTTTPLRDIYNQVLSDCSVFVQGNLTWPSVEQVLRYTRNQRLPPVPTSMDEIYEHLAFGQHPFQGLYKGHVVFGQARAIIFADTEILKKVAGTKFVFCDATFKVRPHATIFSQLLNILVEYKGLIIPVAHVLMTSKEEGLYDAVFDELKNIVPGVWMPDSAMADFETAILNSLARAFPGAKVTGCRFHFGQAILRKVKGQNALDFAVNDSFQKLIRKYFALSLLPSDKIGPALTILEQQCASLTSSSLRKQMKIMNRDYFRKYWMEQVGPQIISNHGLKHRTNNSCENLHSK
jgi:hypothetical protein